MKIEMSDRTNGWDSSYPYYHTATSDRPSPDGDERRVLESAQNKEAFTMLITAPIGAYAGWNVGRFIDEFITPNGEGFDVWELSGAMVFASAVFLIALSYVCSQDEKLAIKRYNTRLANNNSYVRGYGNIQPLPTEYEGPVEPTQSR